ncbi:MAG: hypothetical protein ACLFRY_08615 [Spirochaetia bacterium]
MKRIALILIALVLAAGSVFAVDKYDDLKKTLLEAIEIVDTFVDDLNSADTSGQVAAAIDKYAEDMDEIEPQLEAIEEKYPEITDTHYPQELAEVMVEYSDIGSKMEQAMAVLMQHMMDPEVQEAMERME